MIMIYKRLLSFVLAVVLFSISSIVCSAAELKLSAAACCVINVDTFEVIYSSDAHKRMSMASTTKLMTALILAEQKTPFKEIVATKEMVTVEGSSMGLKEGDTVSYYALLVGMLLASGNDAANTAAISVAGSLEAFAVLMNQRAKEIGMTNTNFVTPSGLDDDAHYSTAYDMSLLACEVLKNDTLREIVANQSMTVSFGSPPFKRRIYNHNKLLSKYKYCIGLKTGYTKKSGRCLVSAAKKDGVTVAAVTLKASDDWNDHIKLLDYGLQSAKSCDLTYKFIDDTMSVVGAYVQRIRIGTDDYTLGCSEETKKEIKANLKLLPFCYAPVKQGQKVGEIEYIYNGKIIHKADVYSLADVEIYKPEKTFFDSFKTNIFTLIKNFL